ncbi:hypothetical protein HBI56_186300 [Parastagonospora nodorum]|uniref:Uncharacterized protein n=1 Tax=Phaeosphaeria nodorum (strain SN15 / ATCC MYA-4574 / FGSC 10173) TaxID=321614 RepID=A0A7U2IB73_PHANO|nr:hypothetical protein HBH56_163290 [Parastagonospora nodorum]QRD06485.1 hypothetical protein JI435_423370 [Parastagonospora nodorum SN15]KAH3931734.1 hypothetical protein HBH54_085950 [Parastagonospora nodorum]KAH3947637.1 hypothetical protein HBH53_113230 [Parastagonospora nodorum]KAH3969048.1 hypothetical protein HBH52_176650 [Parastagonospora nodorum]
MLFFSTGSTKHQTSVCYGFRLLERMCTLKSPERLGMCGAAWPVVVIRGLCAIYINPLLFLKSSPTTATTMLPKVIPLWSMSPLFQIPQQLVLCPFFCEPPKDVEFHHARVPGWTKYQHEYMS